jgi:hypothetical protein
MPTTGTIAGVGIVILSAILVMTRCCHVDKTKQQLETTLEFDMDGISEAPSRFKFKELFVATDNFSSKLGQGGFGAVYKGILANGQEVAVKKMEGSRQGEKQFQAEVKELCYSSTKLQGLKKWTTTWTYINMIQCMQQNKSIFNCLKPARESRKDCIGDLHLLLTNLVIIDIGGSRN